MECPSQHPNLRDERGVALLLALLLALLVAGLAIGVLLMSSNSTLVARFHANEAMMEAAADGGLEWARDRLNGTPTIIPAVTGFTTLQSNATVLDASGATIPGFTRSVYAGPTGNTTGQYGVFASVITVISNARGAVVVRRSELKQDPFSKYARFFNTWTCCMWGRTEVVFGPVHSNQGMAVQTGLPGATFHGPVTTVGAITNQGSGNWNGGVTTGVSPIPFPTTTTLANLQTYATAGNTNVTGWASLPATDPDTRIEFVTVDVNGDGDVNDPDEGYFRVFRTTIGGVQVDKRKYVNGLRWRNMPNGTAGFPVQPAGVNATTDPNLISPNCGGTWNGDWWTADSIYAKTAGSSATKVAAVRAALSGANRRCFLGGDRRLYPDSLMRTSDDYGAFDAWPGWGGSAPSALANALVAQGLAPAGTAPAVALTLWPLSRSQNVNFKGVVYVNGSVTLSGQVRGRVTVVATGNVILGDDIVYVQAPNTTCADILGVLTSRDALVLDNSVNTPFRVNNAWTVAFDDTPNETFQAFFLTLGNFGGDNITGGSVTDVSTAVAPENCGSTTRGCKSIIGGTIQQGVSGTYSGTKGWAETDTWDACGVSAPPPYYPTTGRFTRNRYYELDPVGFNVAAWYAANQ